MVISATNKMFLLTFVLFVLCVVLFFVLVSMRKNEKTLQWENFVRRGQSRRAENGAINHWYFVVRDLDKIRAISEIRNIERASQIEPTGSGFVVHGADYEIVFDRVSAVAAASTTNDLMEQQQQQQVETEEDYSLALVKRKLYPWDVAAPKGTRNNNNNNNNHEKG